MSSLIDSLYTENEVKAIQSLWVDEDSRFKIQKAIGKRILSCDKVLIDLPLTQIIFIASIADFPESKKESCKVAEMVYWSITTFRDNDILPLVSEHQGKPLAARCLVSLSFFYGAVNARHKRHGAPSPDFYRKVGIQKFHEIGEDGISRNFQKWECFLGEMFSL